MMRWVLTPAVLLAAVSSAATASPFEILSSRCVVQTRPSHFVASQKRSIPSHRRLANTTKRTSTLPPSAFVVPILRILTNEQGLDGFLDAQFDRADTNRNGAISIEETYELVLKMYIKINRQAPVKPPSRETVDALFRTADLDRDGRLGRAEFKRLSRRLASRASVRIAAFKAVKFLAAPVLAWKVVRYLSGQSWPKRLANVIFPERFLPTVLKDQLWVTVFTVTFVASLGNIALGTVNFILDAILMRKGKGASEAL